MAPTIAESPQGVRTTSGKPAAALVQGLVGRPWGSRTEVPEVQRNREGDT